VIQRKSPHEATDGWPSGYGASFRISFQSLVFGRGFEPHSIQNLGASVLPVLAVFPFCLRCVLLIFIPQPALSSYTSPDRNRKVWDHAPLVDQRQAIFAVWSSRIFYRIPTFPTWFSVIFKISDRPSLSTTYLTSIDDARLERATQVVYSQLCCWSDPEFGPGRVSITRERPTIIPPIQPRYYQPLCSFVCLTPKRPSIPYTDR
jgi:hypothetical protein